MFNIIVCTDIEGGIGKNNKIPWKLSSDLKRFRELTSKTSDSNLKNAIVMGRKTWESLPRKPLPDRINIIVSNTLKDVYKDENIIICKTFDEVFIKNDKIETYFVIGGAKLYEHALCDPRCNMIYLTKIYSKFDCDVFFPDISFEENDNFKLIDSENCEENGLKYINQTYSKHYKHYK